MSSSKRGSVEIQFNWIFIVIVGSILLLFFYSIVKVQQKSSDTSIGYTTAVDLDAIFTSAVESTGTLNIVKIPETTIDFTCYEYYINNVNKPFNAKSVFAPDRLQGKKLYTWATDWHVPYKVSNFLFVTNDEIRYVILNPENLGLYNAEKVYTDFWDMLPEELNRFTVDDYKDTDANPVLVPDTNDYKTKIVYFRDDNWQGTLTPPKFPEALKGRPDSSVKAIVVAGNDLNSGGMIYFFDKKGEEWELLEEADQMPYLKEDSVVAAMFSENSQVYSCGMQKAFERLGILSKIYAGRTDSIAHKYNTENHWCKSFFTPTYADNMKTDVDRILSDFPTEFSEAGYSGGNLHDLISDIHGLERTNREAISQSCARVY